MGSELEKLFKLQAIDLGLLSKQREIDRYETELAAGRRAMSELAARVEDKTARRKQLVGERALAERRVSDNQVLLRERRSRVARIQTERELRAGESEISTLVEEIDTQEEQLLTLMVQVDEIEGILAGLRSQQAEIEKGEQQQIRDRSQQVDVLRRELDQERSARDEVAADIDASLRKRYELVLERRDGLAVVEVNGSSCRGCHMRVPSQTLQEIMKTGAVRVCPNCQRILYVER